MKFTPNKPVYIAMVIDKPAKTMTAYVYDSELGFPNARSPRARSTSRRSPAATVPSWG